jgi:hypothetical protein
MVRNHNLMMGRRSKRSRVRVSNLESVADRAVKQTYRLDDLAEDSLAMYMEEEEVLRWR